MMRLRLAFAGVATITSVAIVMLPVARAQARTQKPIVLGYYVPYDSSSWVSLQAHADQLDIVAVQAPSIDACGNLSTRDDQTLKQFAHSHGVSVVPSLFTVSAWLNHQILTDEATSAQAIDGIVSYTVAENYDAFDLDLEGVDPADRDALSSFVGATADALHAQGKLLTLAIPAKDRDVTVGWSGAYDYAALGQSADLVTIMAYEYRGPFSGPGSVAPYDWVQRVAAFASRQIAPDKVLLGLALYGYDWNTTSGGARALGYTRALALADHFGAEPALDGSQQSMTFSYTAQPGEALPGDPPQSALGHVISTRTAPPCDVTPPPAGPRPTAVPRPLPDVPQSHEVWIEDSTSAAARVRLADAYALRGVAAWRLGLEDPGIWPLFQAWQQAARAQGA